MYNKLHKLFDRRVVSALLSQAARAAAGVVMVLAIGRLPDSQSVSTWYVLQSVAAWVLLLEMGLGGFLSSLIARSSADQEAGVVAKALGLMGGVLGMAALASICLAFFAPHFVKSASVLAVGATALGVWAALFASLAQAVMQGMGWVSETLNRSATAQLVRAVLAMASLIGGASLEKICIAWAASNLIWCLLLVHLARGRVRWRALVPAENPCGFLTAEFGRWKPFLLGSLSGITFAKLLMLLLSFSFPSEVFARFAYTQDIIVAGASLLSFTMNGAAVTLLRSTRAASDLSSEWGRFKRTSWMTVAGILAMMIAALCVVPFASVQVGNRLLTTGMGGLLVLAVVFETASTWYRTVAQGLGRSAGVMFASAATIAGILSAVGTRSVPIYLAARIVLAAFTWLVDYRLASQGLKNTCST